MSGGPGEPVLDNRPGDGGLRPVPDPTALTDAAIEQAIRAERERVDGQLLIRDERINGIDRATQLRTEAFEHLPAAISQEVAHAKELVQVQIAADRRFEGAAIEHLREVDDIRFQAAERLAGRESELNALALAAAFAAQKEASAKEAEYTRIASVKSENATTDALEKLGLLFATQFAGLAGKVDDIKDRTGRIESTKAGATESRTGLYALIGAIVGILTILLFAVALFAALKP